MTTIDSESAATGITTGSSAFVRDLKTIPNMVVLARIVMFIIVIPLYYSGHPYVALTIGFTAGLMDVLDGWLARRLDQVTELGALLDQVGDNLSVLIALGLGLQQGLWPLHVLYLWGFREITVMAMRRHAALQGFSIPTHWLGKVGNHGLYYSFIPMIPALVMRGEGDYGTLSTVFYYAALGLVHFGLVFQWTSGGIYAVRFMRGYKG